MFLTSVISKKTGTVYNTGIEDDIVQENADNQGGSG